MPGTSFRPSLRSSASRRKKSPVKRLQWQGDFFRFFLVLTRGILFICASFFMRAAKTIGLAILILAVFLPELGAQTNAVTLTNYVTVEVTNVVTITNVVSAAAAVPVATNAVTEVKKSPWEGSVSAGLTLTRGNSHTLLYSGTVQVKRKTPENEFLLGGNGAYGSQNSEATVNNYGGYSQWNHLF